MISMFEFYRIAKFMFYNSSKVKTKTVSLYKQSFVD